MPLPLSAKRTEALRSHEGAKVVEWYAVLGSRRLSADIGRAIQNQTRNQFARGARKSEYRSRTLRHADERDAPDFKVPAQAANVRNIARRCGAPGRQSEASTIEADDAKAVAKRRHLRLPHLQIESPTVHHQNDGTVALIPISNARALNIQVLIEFIEGSRSRWETRAANGHMATFSHSEVFFAIRLLTNHGAVKNAGLGISGGAYTALTGFIPRSSIFRISTSDSLCEIQPAAPDACVENKSS